MNVMTITDALKAFICTQLLNDPNFQLATDVSLVNEGYLDSFALMEIATFAESEFGVAIDTDELAELAEAENDSLTQIAALVSSKGA